MARRRQEKPAAGMHATEHLVINVEGATTPPHAFDDAGHHYSQQDYQFRKQLCVAHPDHHDGEPGDADFYQRRLADTAARRLASDDAYRERLNKKQDENHRTYRAPNIKSLFQPGDEDGGDEFWGVIRETRASDTPHWSHKQFQTKKNINQAAIHRTQKNRSEVNNQSTMRKHFIDPVDAMTQKVTGESGQKHTGNSHDHLLVAKRRHQMAHGNNETFFRSKQPPGPSHPCQFFQSPEPEYPCAQLYPEGPSVTSKHAPKHFVDNVNWDQADRSSTSTTPNQRALSARSMRTPRSDDFSVGSRDSMTQSRVSNFVVLDGTRMKTVGSVTQRHPPGVRVRTAPATFGPPDDSYARSARRSRSSEPFRFDHTAGKPPHIMSRLYDGAGAYRSHAQICYDKTLCQAPLRHTSRWERLEQQSDGHSAGGSEFGSLADGHGEAHDRRANKAVKTVSNLPSPNRTGGKERRRAASSDGLGQSRRIASSRRSG